MKIDGGVPVLVLHPDDPTKWVLCRDLFFWLGEDLEYVLAGFVTDFASIPRIFWGIIAPNELGDQGPIKHDWRYRKGLGTRLEADNDFLADMKADKIPAWRRYSAYLMVRICGAGSWNSGNVEFIPIEGEL
jgi:hypothetical protein